MQAGANVQMNATACSRGSPTRRASRRFNRGRSASIGTASSGISPTIPGFLNCKNPGAVRQFQTPYGVQFVEDAARQRIFVLIGGGNRNYRIIYMDGREQQGQVQGDDDNPLYYGRAVAHWEGDTFVVRTTGFNEDFWFTNGGLPHTDQLSLVERFSRPDYDTLRYEVTVDDPGAYTQPWSSGWELRWVGGEELPVYFCQDNRS